MERLRVETIDDNIIMKKEQYILLSPDPMDECKQIVYKLKDWPEILSAINNEADNPTYRIKIITRTKQWYEKLEELGY